MAVNLKGTEETGTFQIVVTALKVILIGVFLYGGLQAFDASVPVHGLIRVGHDAEDTILHTIEQHDCDTVLMGWSGHSSRRNETALGSTVDKVVQNAESDVLVERVGPNSGGDVELVLLPVAGGTHAEFAAETAHAIAKANDATVDLTHVVDPSADQQTRDEKEELLTELTDEFEGVSVERSLLEGADVVDTIVAESENYDVTVVGATRDSRLRQIGLGVIPEEVGRRAQNTTIMAKRYGGLAGGPKARLSRVVS